ncbi:MAG: DNA polymerase III subunit delta' [Prolixibacteraceae bacterium]|jgi:DNA polymerase-3 subunit delta'|nr:DNA polymerase III subunit delta' [Prolixibacteraceae bacterium]
MQFNRVIGQQAIKKRLIDGVNENRISHALLFSGPEGVGKLAMAIAYAQFINCPDRTDTDSCGTCPSCKKFKKLIHPDLHFVFPVVKTPKFKSPVSDNYISQWREKVISNPYFNLNMWYKAIDVENAQGSIYVHESSEIIRKLNLKTFESEYKIMIIWMAERMNVQCANKLLKMIEEPPPKTLFVLITENEEQILPTIRSRTQLIKFTGIDSEAMTEAVAEIPQSEGKNIDGIVHLAKGNFITALDLLQPDEEKAFYFEQFASIMRITYKRDWDGMFSWTDNIAGIGRERQKSFLSYCMRMVRENFIMNFKRPDLVFLNEKEKGFSEHFSPFINERNIIPFSEELEKAYRDIAQNGNPRLIFLDFSLKVVKMIRA